ncbi:MAG: regulatory protein RecX [Fretibacterium sp.]
MGMQEEKGLSPEEHRLRLFRLLSRAPRPEQEVRERLAAWGVTPEEAEALIVEFRGMSLLDDALYARLFVEGHESWGDDRIACELSQRGIARRDVVSALEGRDEEAQARALAAGWLAGGMETGRVVSRLRRRGFSGRTIRSVIEGKDEIPW